MQASAIRVASPTEAKEAATFGACATRAELGLRPRFEFAARVVSLDTARCRAAFPPHVPSDAARWRFRAFTLAATCTASTTHYTTLTTSWRSPASTAVQVRNRSGRQLEAGSAGEGYTPALSSNSVRQDTVCDVM